MTARVLPFPAVARPHEVRRLVDRLSGLTPDQAQSALVSHMTRRVCKLRKIAVAEDLIRRDLVALEGAVNHRLSTLPNSRGRSA